MRMPVREELLSEFAKSKFAIHGRGAVVVEEQGVVELPGRPQAGTVLAYLYEGSPLFEQVGSRWPGTTKLAVDTYDPSREMVVILLDRSDGLEAFLLPLAAG